MSRALLQQWQRTCSAQCAKQENASKCMRRCNIGINLTVILLSAASAVAGTSNLPVAHDAWVVTLMTGVGWAVAVLTGVNHFMAFSKKQQEYLTCSRRYDNLYRTIDMVLSASSSPSALQTQQIEHEYNALELETPMPLACCC